MNRESFRLFASLLALAAMFAAAGDLQPLMRSRQTGLSLATVGDKLKVELSLGEEYPITIILKPEEYLRLAVSSWGSCLSVAMFDPAGSKIAGEFLLDENPTVVSLISSDAGRYTLRLLPAGAGPDTVRLEIQLVERKAAGDTDKARLAAERNCLEAQQLQRQWTRVSDTRAMTELQDAVQLWTGIGDHENAARALLRLGDLYQDRSRLPDAQGYYDRALDLSSKAGNQNGIAEALARLGLVRILSGKPQQALEILEKAQVLNRKAGNLRNEALVLANIGEAHYWMGMQPEAVAFYLQSIRLWKTLGERRGAALATYYLGSAYSDLSDVRNAFQHFDEALKLWRTISDRHGEALALTQLGSLYNKIGEKQEAINQYRVAATLFQNGGDPIGEAMLMSGLGSAYLGLGDQEVALDYFQKALALCREGSLRTGEAGQLMRIGEIRYLGGDLVSAQQLIERALAIYTAIEDRRMTGISFYYLGILKHAKGDLMGAVEWLNRALTLSREMEDSQDEARILDELGLTYADMGRERESLDCLAQALTLRQKAQDRAGEAQTRYSLAKAHNRSGNEAEALSQIESSIRIIESLRTKVDVPSLRISFFSSTLLNYDLYIDLLMKSQPGRPGEDRDALALAANERARARNLLDLLEESRAGIRRSIPPEVAERERDLLRSLNAKAQQQARLMSGRHSREDADTLAAEIRSLNTEYDQLEAEIRIRNPRYAALTQPNPLDLGQIQEQVLDDHTLMLEYSLGEEHSWLWAATRSDLASYELPPRKRIEPLARRVRELLTARQVSLFSESASQRRARALQADAEYWRAAAELSGILLGPAADRLGTHRLLVVADGILQHIPFGALPLPGTDEANHNDNPVPSPVPLITRHMVVSMPSASALALLRQFAAGRTAAEKSVAILADPVYQPDDPRVSQARTAPSSLKAGAGPPQDGRQRGEAAPQSTPEEDPNYARLPFSGREAEYISALTSDNPGARWLGPEATRERATSPELARYRIVHFATHGLVNDLHPNLSGVVLSTYDARGRELDGFLRLHDIYNLNLPVELVVLSACNTGLGKDVRGEGLISLVRGFMYAGASRVVASFWRVDDESTAELMRRFYRSMLKGKLPPAQALQAAQVEMSRHVRWSAPYYWAGFVFHGEYR